MKFLKNFSIEKIKSGLEKTRNSLINKLTETFTGKAVIDENTLEQLEEILISADMGSNIAEEIVNKIRKDLTSVKDKSFEQIKQLLKLELKATLNEYSNPESVKSVLDVKPYIILVVGINGTGKTTSIAKLANLYKSMNHNVLIVSADKFRAAANEQLEVWAKRVDVPVFNASSKDPSAVVFDSIKHAQSKEYDIVIIDTAGRLHTHKNLMEELQKINKVITNFKSTGPDFTYLVIDGSTGQNGLLQAKEFSKYVNISGFIVTKLDGTAKGGIIFQICKELKRPIKFIGVGEKIDDFMEFNADMFVDSII
ncbi:MAG: signal recognition particle-docking protein FtsY [Ignavibacteria bacterium]|nr:signal recognition particle-docking protein FtsY [Ignavibacteria bacterium]